MNNTWTPGDRCGLHLPDRTLKRYANRTDTYVTGTVTAVDQRGVHVKLDRLVNGIDTCYATHDELQPA